MRDERRQRERGSREKADAEREPVVDGVEAAGCDRGCRVADADDELAETVGTATETFGRHFGDG